MEQFSGAMTNMVYRCGLQQDGGEVQVRRTNAAGVHMAYGVHLRPRITAVLPLARACRSC